MKKKLARLLALCLTVSLSVLPAAALELEDARELLRTQYVDPIPEEILALDSLDAILAALDDPYTVYYTAEEYAAFLESVNGETLVGIGVSIQTVYDGGFRILAVLPDTPAQEAGLVAGDCIIAVDGVALSTTSDITGALGGEAGTSVTVTVLRADGTLTDFTLVRRVFSVPIVTYEMDGDACLIDCCLAAAVGEHAVCKVAFPQVCNVNE